MSEIKFQWVTPIGGVTPPMSLEESSDLIRTGRVFPAQFVSLNGATPTLAAAQPDLQSAWMAVTPKETPFEGHSGRVNILTLGKLFAHCALNRLHGRLFVRHNDSGLHFMLRFASGQLIEVSALDPSTYFGQLCLQQQLVSATQLMQAIEHAPMMVIRPTMPARGTITSLRIQAVAQRIHLGCPRPEVPSESGMVR